MELSKFNPTIAELQALVKETSAITTLNPEDKAQLKVVKANRLKLRDARVAITKKGKELRQEAVDFQKAVIAKEKELVAIVEPEENRLLALEENVELIAEAKRRADALPARTEKLKVAGLEGTDDELLGLSDAEFDAFFNGKVSEKNEKERQAIEADKAKVEEEKNRLEREKEIRAAEDKARETERERIEAETKAREARAEQDRKDAEEQAAREIARKAQQEKEVAEKLKKAKKYRDFRSKLGWTDETKNEFKEEKIGNEVVLWKKLGIFVIE